MKFELLSICALIALSSITYAQYPVIKPTLTIINDGCPIGFMKTKGGACVESSGTLIPIPSLDGSCPPHYYEIEGKCHRSSEPSDTCPSGYTNRRGKCRPIVNPCTSGFDYEFGRCAPIQGN